MRRKRHDPSPLARRDAGLSECAPDEKHGPEAVAALSDPELRDKLQDFITNRREEINYRIYAFNKL